MEVLTKEECKKILSRIGFKLGVSPNLIATRLLSEDDKQDMLNGDLAIDELEAHIRIWMENGMPDYAHDKTESYEKEKLRLKENREKLTLDENHAR